MCQGPERVQLIGKNSQKDKMQRRASRQLLRFPREPVAMRILGHETKGCDWVFQGLETRATGFGFGPGDDGP